MRLFDDIGNTLKALRMHVFGKGAMTLAVLGASVLSAATGFAWVLPVVAIGGVALTAVNRFYRESLYKNQMVDLYRDEIADRLGIAPHEVTQSHLKIAARENEVLDQALKRQRNKTWLSIGTAVLSSAITVLLVGAFEAQSILKTGAETLLGNMHITGALGAFLSSAVNLIGIGTIAGLTSLVFHTGINEMIEGTTGIGKAAAHDRIIGMDFDVKRGRTVSKEQVYGVLVAGNPKLQQAIAREFKQPYDHMPSRRRTEVLQQIGVSQEMQILAGEINAGRIAPGRLAFMLDEVHHPEHAKRTTEPAAPVSQPERTGFVERMNLAPREASSHRARVDAARATVSELQR